MQVKGCCPLDCQDSCAWVAHVEDGRVVKVEGAKDHPVTRGVLCAKVKDYEARLTAPGTIAASAAAVGPQGRRRSSYAISWDEALDEIASRFKDIIAEHGAEALMPFSYLGTQGVVQRLALVAPLPCAGRQPADRRRLRRLGHLASGCRGIPSASIRRRRPTRSSSSCGGRTCSRPATTSGTSSRKRGSVARRSSPSTRAARARRSNATCTWRRCRAPTPSWRRQSDGICWKQDVPISSWRRLWVE